MAQAPGQDTKGYISNGIFMCRALITIVLGAVMLGASFSAPAHMVTSSLPVKPIAGLDAPPITECLVAGTTSRSTAAPISAQNPVSGQVIPLTYQGTDRVVSVPVQYPVASQSGGNNSSWRSITALLSTLALIGTIALRRYKAGKF